MPQDTADDQSTLIQATSHYLSQCGLRFLTPQGASRPYWVNTALQWRQNERDGVSNHQPHDGLLNCLLRRKSKKTSRLRVTGLCAGNSPLTDEFLAQKASNAENVSSWWRHYASRRVHYEYIYVQWIADPNGSYWDVSHISHQQWLVINCRVARDGTWCVTH